MKIGEKLVVHMRLFKTIKVWSLSISSNFTSPFPCSYRSDYTCILIGQRSLVGFSLVFPVKMLPEHRPAQFLFSAAGYPVEALRSPEFAEYQVSSVMPSYPVWLLDTPWGIATLTLICLIALALIIVIVVVIVKCCLKRRNK